MLNVSVIWFFFFREKRRCGGDAFRFLIFPLLGILILAYVWSGFDWPTQVVGAVWLVIGLAIGFVKSKGYKEVPEAFRKQKL